MFNEIIMLGGSFIQSWKYNSDKYYVNNAGIYGLKSSDMIEKYHSLLSGYANTKNKPIVVLYIGTNDLTNMTVDPLSITFHLTSFIQTIMKFVKHIYVISILKSPKYKESYKILNKIDWIHYYMKTLCNSMDELTYVSLNKMFRSKKHFMSNGIKLSPESYQKLSAHFEKLVM